MKYLKLFLLLAVTCLSAQDKVFVDENIQYIDSLQYVKKCKNLMYKCLQYKTDSFEINKILYKYNFGKLEPTAYNQVRKLLIRDSKTQIDTNTTLVIKYYDSIYSFQTIYQKHLKHMKSYETLKKQPKDSTEHTHFRKHTYNIKKYNKNKKKWINTRNKCVKKFEKNESVRVFHVFKHEQNVTHTYENFNWIEDRGTYKNTFFQIMFNYSLVIIKPDGSYFLSGFHLLDDKVKLLLKTPDWTTFENDWKETVEIYVINGKGFFKKKEEGFYHIKHCF